MSAGSKRRREHMRYGRTPGNMCIGKYRYLSQQAANAVIQQMPGYARSYRCPTCKYLHLTSKQPHKKDAA